MCNRVLFYREEKITKLKIFSVLIGFIGLVVLFLSGVTGISGEGDLGTGGILALIGVQGLALSNITNRKHSQYIPAKVYLFTQWFVGGVISIILFFILDGNIEVITYSTSFKLFGLVFIDIASYSLFFYTIKRVSASFTTSFDVCIFYCTVITLHFFCNFKKHVCKCNSCCRIQV